MNGLQIDKENEDYQICTGCTKKCTDVDSMETDSGGNYFCPECWEELAPVMRRDYEELKQRGEVD